jgi:ribosomal protein S6
MGELGSKVKEKTQKVKVVLTKQGGKVVAACKKGWEKLRSTIKK